MNGQFYKQDNFVRQFYKQELQQLCITSLIIKTVLLSIGGRVNATVAEKRYAVKSSSRAV